MKDSFVLYKSHFESICMLPEAEQQMKVLKRICDFMFNDVEPVIEDLSTTEKIIVTMAMPTLNNAKINYENGCKGGAPVGNQNAKKKTTENNPPCFSKTTPQTTNVNVKENLKENLKENVVCCNTDNNNNSLPSAPTIQAVRKFCKQNNLTIDPEYFFTYYEEKGWDKVKDWKNAALGWDRRQEKPVEQKMDHPYSKQFACPSCKEKTIFWNNKIQKYHCDSCNQNYADSEVE